MHDIINIIIPHFSAHQLCTEKYGDFMLFQQGTPKSWRATSIRASMNRGTKSEGIVHTLNPHWVVGFTSGDGSFIAKTSLNRGKPRARIGFNISQNIRDANLMNSLVHFFGCGKVHNNASKNMLVFEVYDFNDAYSIIMPFLNHILF